MTDTSASSYVANTPLFGPCSVIVTGTEPVPKTFESLFTENAVPLLAAMPVTPVAKSWSMFESSLSCKVITGFVTDCALRSNSRTQLSAHMRSPNEPLVDNATPPLPPFSSNTW